MANSCNPKTVVKLFYIHTGARVRVKLLIGLHEI